jgi:hypothetical protein
MTQMLQEFVSKIQELATEAVKPTILQTPGQTRTVLLFKPDGTYELIGVPPAAHREDLDTPQELARFINHQMADGKPIVYLSMTQAVALYDKDDRRDRAFSDLELHPQWKLILDLDKSPRSLDQRAFVRMLRVQFDGCFPDSRLIDLLRNLNWESGDKGNSVVGHGNVGISKSVMAQVTGQAAIPEEVTLFMPIWTGIGYISPRMSVRCAIEITPETKCFALIPYPGEVTKAESSAMAELTEMLAGDIEAFADIQIYQGSPGK